MDCTKKRNVSFERSELQISIKRVKNISILKNEINRLGFNKNNRVADPLICIFLQIS